MKSFGKSISLAALMLIALLSNAQTFQVDDVLFFGIYNFVNIS